MKFKQLSILLLLILQSCSSQKVRVFKSNEMNSILLDNINYFNEVDSYKNIYIKENNDTLFILNVKNVTFKLDNKYCIKYKGFDVIVDDENSTEFIKLNIHQECIDPLKELFNNSEELNLLYGSIYSIESMKHQKPEPIVRGDLETLMPYLKSIMVRRVKINEPEDKIPISTYHQHPGR